MTQQPYLVIHHDDADGIVAALVIERHLALDPPTVGVEFHATNYGCPPPDVQGRDVVIVDFSYPRAELERLHAEASSLRVYDHHESAQAVLADLPYCHFDMARSGCGLVWDELIGGPRPWLVNYIEDADLWRFALPDSRKVRAYLNSFPQTVDALREFFGQDLVPVPPFAVVQGDAILRYQQRLVEDAVRLAEQRWFEPPSCFSDADDGRVAVRVPCLAMPIRALISVVAGELAKGHPFAACYYFDPESERYRFSLRSTEDGADVSIIARAYDGGGHKHAAGFTIGSLEDL